MFESIEIDFSSPTAITLSVIAIAGMTLLAVAEWRVLTKAGEKGWKSLVPFYNIYISHHIVGMAHFWFVLEVIVWVTELILEIAEPVPDWLEIGFGIITAIITLIFAVIHAKKLGSCFGKGKGFQAGLFLLPEVFLPVLSFGKAQYSKPEHS